MVSQEDARKHIETIWSDYASGSQRIKGALEGALLTVQKGFSKEGHYLYEFIQNADDAGATAVQVTLEDQRIEILNNGQSFQRPDVEALCDIGHSTKSPENYIGYLGVGFKSVFLISDGPEVHSGPYHFAFRIKGLRKDFPWQVAPVWTEVPIVPHPWRTQFVIPLRDSSVAKKIGEEMRPDSLNRRVLLFLQSIRRLELVDRNAGLSRVVQLERLNAGTYELRETSDFGTVQESWVLLSSGPVPVPEDIRRDLFTQNWNRDAATHRGVTIAFKLKEDGGLDAVPGTVHMGVFSYLPLREETTRLKFVVQADFLTSIGRTRIVDEAAWNRWLARKVVKLVKDKSADLLANARFQQNVLEILWPASSSSNDFFAVHVERPLSDYLQSKLRLPAYDGTWVTPQEALYVSDPDMWDLIGPVDLERLYRKKPIQQDVKVPHDYKAVEHAPYLFGNSRQPGFVSCHEGHQLLSEKASNLDVNFFKRLYERMALPGWQPGTYRSAPLAQARIVLASDGTVERTGQIFFKPEQLQAAVESKFKFVHPAIASDTSAHSFLEMIGVGELSDQRIKEVIAESIIPQVRDRWPFLPNEEKLAWLVSFKTMVERREIAPHALQDFITLPTKSGWLPAKDLLFPSEYSPDPNIEPLVNDRLIDDPAVQFVSACSGHFPGTRESWKTFLEALGVSAPAHDQNRRNRWANRVGILFAQRYEKIGEPRLSARLPSHNAGQVVQAMTYIHNWQTVPPAT